jgi:hypothetical protein
LKQHQLGLRLRAARSSLFRVSLTSQLIGLSPALASISEALLVTEVRSLTPMAALSEALKRSGTGRETEHH